MSAKIEVILEDYEERFAPPQQDVLKVAMVGNLVYLTIAEYDETYHTTNLKNKASFMVDISLLRDTLDYLDCN